MFEGKEAIFKHEQGALYVACLVPDPPPEPLHAVALALKARKINGQAPEEAELIQERNLGLDDAEAVRNLRRKQRELEAVLEDDLTNVPAQMPALSGVHGNAACDSSDRVCGPIEGEAESFWVVCLPQLGSHTTHPKGDD